MPDEGIGLILGNNLLENKLTKEDPTNLARADRKRVSGTTDDSKPTDEATPQSKEAKGEGKGDVEDDKQEKKHFSKSKGGRLIAIIIILVVSWLIVKIWSDIFDLFMKKVIKTDQNKLIANICIAIIFTVLIIWALIALGLDSWLSC